jgi:predicted choloylglycine hydrolase
MDKIIEKLRNISTNHLIDAVKNYRQYGYDESTRTAILSILEERGINTEYLTYNGHINNYTYDSALEEYNRFCKNVKIAFVLYILSFIMSIGVPLLGFGIF